MLPEDSGSSCVSSASAVLLFGVHCHMKPPAQRPHGWLLLSCLLAEQDELAELTGCASRNPR